MSRASAAGIYFFSIAAAIVAYAVLEKSPSAHDSSSLAATALSAEARVVPDGWREYRNTAYHFSVLYPQELAVKEYPEGGNAVTVTFENSATKEGFQIFVVPYGESHVSEARFKKDIPSGVRTEVTTVSVDGATGAAFYSTNATLGETREIWFTHGGFLFETTTLKPLETWFGTIMQTWEFL